MNRKKAGFSTRAIHAGEREEETGAVVTPIYQTAPFEFKNAEHAARVIEVFRRAPDLWILMGIYGSAIFYGLGVLKLIERANP